MALESVQPKVQMELEEAQGDAPCGSPEVEIEEEDQLRESLFLLGTHQKKLVWREAPQALSVATLNSSLERTLVRCRKRHKYCRVA
jgi:hypothetical protein